MLLSPLSSARRAGASLVSSTSAAAAAAGCRRRASASASAGQVTGRSTSDCVRVLAEHWSPAVPRSPKGNNIVVASAAGSWLTSVEGRRYLDLQTGIGVANTGHCHPRVVAAIQAQAARGIHLQQNCTISQPVVALIERLNDVTPPELTRFFFNVTGTEACESAVKLARHATGRQNIIVFRGGFHGRSLAALAMTSSKTAYGVGYGPLPAGIFHTPFPTCLHCRCAGRAGGASPGAAEAAGAAFSCCGAPLAALRELLLEVSAPRDTAAILIEPVLGEGGYLPPPPGFLAALRALCDEHGMLLMLDEVQSGVGRSGRFWAHEHEAGVVPDVLVFAKGIASGVPLAGIATRGHLMDRSPAGSMGGTYGANAIAAAAAVATIDAIADERMLENAAARGAQLQRALRALAARHPGFTADVRGRGCMVGWEFAMPPGCGFAGAVTAAAMDEGLLLLTAGWRETIRFIPPINISEADMATAIDMLGRAYDRAVAAWTGPPPLAA